MKYGDFQHLKFDHGADGALVITINRPEQMNATNARLHLWAGAFGDLATLVPYGTPSVVKWTPSVGPLHLMPIWSR